MFNGPVFNNEVVQANSRAVNNAGFSESLDEANSLYSRLTGASFELVPSSYKGGVVYSGVPNTGNGDLTWTRGSDAWRTNANGLIQRVPWNLFTQSIWSGGGALPTGWSYSFNSGTSAPVTSIYGIGSAYSFTTSGTRQVFNQSLNYISGNTYSLSIRVESVSGTIAVSDIIFFNGGGTLTYFEDGASVSASKAVVAGKTYTTVIACNTTATQQVRVGSGCTASTTGTVVLSQPQLIDGSTTTPYFPTTDRLNVPRLSYEYGSAPALLLEPQRTNLCFYSAQLDDATWTKLNSSITANATTSPDGTTNADKIVETNTTALHGVLQSITTTASTYAISFYAKASERNFIQWNNQVSTEYINFDLTNGAVGSSSGVTNASIQSVGSGWYRCSFNFVSTVVGAAGFMRLIIVTSATSARLENYVGNGTSGLFVWGTQFELGAYPTTHIPTQATTVTRLSDSFSRNNIYTNGLITAAGGTWFVELRNNVSLTRSTGANINQSLGISDGSSSGIVIRTAGTSRAQIYKYISSTPILMRTTDADTVKIAIKWNGTSADVFENGVKVVSASSFTTTNMNFLDGSAVDFPKYINEMALFPTPLSDDQCVALTSDFTEGESVIGSYERYVNSNGGAVENLNTITNLIQNLK